MSSRDKSLLIAASIPCASTAFALMSFMNFSGTGVTTGTIGLSLALEVIRLRTERRRLRRDIEPLERRVASGA